MIPSLYSKWSKLFQGDTRTRPTRFHTQDGNLAPWLAYFGLPRAIWQWIRWRYYGKLVERPWIPPSATRKIQGFLTPDTRVLEIGGGMSTLWLAKRCRSLLSIEADQKWFDQLRALVVERGLNHVDLQFRWQASEMCDFSSLSDGSLDFCLIDGGPRLECIQAALPKMKPDGLIYVDNTDLYIPSKEFLLTLPAMHSCRLSFHRGFAPACLFINEGAFLEMIPANG